MIKGTEGIFSPPRISPTFSARSLPGEASSQSSVSDRIRDTRSYPACDGLRGAVDDKPTLLYGLPPSFISGEPKLTSSRRTSKILDNPTKSPTTNSHVACSKPLNPSRKASDPSSSVVDTAQVDSNTYPLGHMKDKPSREEYLAEIPLSIESNPKLVDSEHTNLSTSSPFLPRAINREKDHLVQKFSSQPDAELIHEPLPVNVDLQDDDDDVVSEFLRSHTDPQPFRNLPSVEDGLSSGSELDTPHTRCKNRNRVSKMEQHLPSCSPDSTRGLFLGSSKDSRPWERADISSAGEPLVNPPLVQDIWEIVHEIKQTLNDDKAALDKSVDPSLKTFDDKSRISNFNNANAKPDSEDFDKSAENTEEPRSDRITERCRTSHSGHTRDFRLPFKQRSSGDGTCKKLTVCASIEQPVAGSESDQSNTQSQCAQRHNTGNGDHDDVERFVSTNREAHQWTFPTAPNTVYSSSEEDDNVTASSRTRRHGSMQEKQPTLSELATPNPESVPGSHDRHPPTRSGTRRNSAVEGNVSHQPVQHCQPATESRKPSAANNAPDYESDEDTDQLLDKPYQSDKPVYIPELKREANLQAERKGRVREVSVRHPDFPDTLLHGVLFRASYLGSTQLLSQKQPSRNSRMFQAQEAVNRVKAPDGENQPSVAVALFVSTDRIMILNSNLQEILIDHELKSVSYIADIGEIFVLMARRPETQSGTSNARDPQSTNDSSENKTDVNAEPSDSGASSSTSDGSVEDNGRPSQPEKFQSLQQRREISTKLICHVLESSEARLIAQAVGHAFQLAYLDFLRENGIEDLSSVKQLNYEEVLNQQEIFCDELTMFSDKDRHKQITIPKQRGEPLGVVIVSSGWGSLLPTALLANMNPVGPAARCGQLNIGNHIISVNGQSLVGLPLNTCQQIIKSCRNQTAVKLIVVDCPPVVEVLIRRPSLQYQLGFSVQDGVICSLLRGGIAERGGIRVDHRIIEINGQSVVAVSHERIVHLLASAVGEIHIRTMPTSVFRLLTGQDTPNYI